MAVPVIDKLRCEACGSCIKVCPARCIILEGTANLVHPEKCISCGRCVRACPVKAISFA